MLAAPILLVIAGGLLVVQVLFGEALERVGLKAAVGA